MFTISGKRIDLVNPDPCQFDIHDIATGLSNLCRYNGQTPIFYSVAQHSVLASHLVPEDLALQALLHDAAEAYLGDVVRPLKALLKDYQRIEKHFETVLFHAFGLPAAMDYPVKKADQMLLLTEVRDLGLKIPMECIMGGAVEGPWSNYKIVPVPADQAYTAFMDRFKELGGFDAHSRT